MKTFYRQIQLSAVILLLWNGLASPVIGQENYSPEALKHDLEFLIQTMEEVHPNLYAYTPKEKIDEIQSAIKKNIQTPLTRIDFYREITPLATNIQDGHTGIIPPAEEYLDYRNKGGLVFPIDVIIKDNRIFVQFDYTRDGSVPAGSEILTLNDYPASRVIRELLHYSNGERPAWRYRLLSGNFRILLWLIYGFGETFQLDLRSSITGEVERQCIKGIDRETLSQAIENRKLGQPADYAYHSIAGLKTGIIDFRNMRDPGAFKSFLKNTFSTMQTDGVEYLIIDLRNNGGGHSRLGDMLLDYLTDRPFSQFSGTEIKISRQYQIQYKKTVPGIFRWIPSILFPYPAYRKIMSAETGTTVYIPAEPIKPRKNPLRFDGRVYVLIGPGTFSSAVALASAIKDHSIGILVGEETGGLATPYGNAYVFSLPNTKLH
ncbi:MAG TPA: hypothetical protein ENN03_03965, partial [bacterium]|nr:hypothetical protein [bacterium]